jgi:branched-chain amino acid transport system ATP-binding protein
MSAVQSAALRTQGLHKAYGSLVVTDNVCFELGNGGRHALIGPNGAGKTTFINLVTGQARADHGGVWLHGQDVSTMPAHRRVKQGLIRTFQVNQLFLGLPVIENVAMAIAEREASAWNILRPCARYTTHYDEAHGLLRDLRLETKALRKVSELAYGEQRLLEIAIALALKPKVLLLDEPAAGVPSGENSLIMEALERLPSSISILLIEHDMELVFRFASRITVLERGRVLVEGSPKEVAADEQVRAIYFGENGGPAHG